MEEVSEKIDDKMLVGQAVIDVLGAIAIPGQKLLTNGSQVLDLSSRGGEMQEVVTEQKIPSIGVNYLLRELRAVFYDMPRKPFQYEGSAYKYSIAIRAIGLHAGLSMIEDIVHKKREEVRKVKLAIPDSEEKPRPYLIGPKPYKWLFLTRPGPEDPEGKRINLYCVRPSLKRRFTDLGEDFEMQYSTLAEMALVFAFADMGHLDPYYLIKFKKEAESLKEWFGMFKGAQ